MDAVERGRELARLRKAAELTQRKVANHFGLTASAVSEWERGAGAPEWHRIRALDDLLGAQGAVLRLFDLGSVTTSAEPLPSGFAAAFEVVQRQLDALSARLDRLERPAPGSGRPRRATSPSP